MKAIHQHKNLKPGMGVEICVRMTEKQGIQIQATNPTNIIVTGNGVDARPCGGSDE